MQVLIDGIVVGALYALVATGLSLIFGILEIPDFALGGRLMIAAYVASFTVVLLHQNYWIGVLAGVATSMILGALSELAVYRQLRKRSSALTGFIGALALLTVMEVGVQLLWGANYRELPSPYNYTTLKFGGTGLSLQRLLAAGGALSLIAMLHLLLRFTKLGRAMRATIEDRHGALLVGISPNTATLSAAVIGSGLAGAAGGLVGPLDLVYPTMGDPLIISAFIVVIFAGMRSSGGVILGGISLGLIESIGSRYISANYADAYGFLLLIVVLVLRPEGLFTKSLIAR